MWDPNTRTATGKTFAEVDAEQAVYVRDLNAALAEARNKTAGWWQYMVSHRTFELVVGGSLGKDNIVICLNACSRIAGPVNWPNQQLELVWHNPPEERNWQYVLADESVGFRAESGTLHWRRNYNIHRYESLYCPQNRDA